MFDTLTEEEIQQCCSSQVYYRGVDYFENGHVSRAEFNANRTLLTAKVKGSRTYTVHLSLKERKIGATCTCLQDAVCKHIVATMLYAIVENVDTQSTPAKSNADMEKYLNGLSKQELTGLVMKYAPDEFYTMVSNRHSGISDAQKTFSKAKRSLEEIFSNEASLYDPDQFEESLMKVLKGLSGLEKKLPKKIAELILDVIVKVEEATDEGSLYNHYSDYNFEPSEQFYEFR